ncbi:MAG: hypothetical protein R3C54_05770 [Parvularculaceae bacterium]
MLTGGCLAVGVTRSRPAVLREPAELANDRLASLGKVDFERINPTGFSSRASAASLAAFVAGSSWGAFALMLMVASLLCAHHLADNPETESTLKKIQKNWEAHRYRYARCARFLPGGPISDTPPPHIFEAIRANSVAWLWLEQLRRM